MPTVYDPSAWGTSAAAANRGVDWDAFGKTYGPAIQGGLTQATNAISAPPSNKKQAQQQFAADQNRFLATGGAQSLIDQFINAQRRMRNLEMQGHKIDLSKSQELIASLKDPSSFNLKRDEKGGLVVSLPTFNDPRFSGLEFGKVKGRALQAGGQAAMTASSIPTVASPFLAAGGAIAGAIGRRREANSRIPVGEQNALAADLMRQAIRDPAGALTRALQNERRATSMAAVGKQIDAGDLISMLRSPDRLNELDLVRDPATGRLIYAPTNVRTEKAPGDTTPAGWATFSSRAVNRMTPFGTRVNSRIPFLRSMLRRTPRPTTRVDAYGRTVFTGEG